MIVVAAFGLWILRLVGVIPPDSVAVPQALVMASAVGGVLVGAGFAIGGYCPGTSVAGLASGHDTAVVRGDPDSGAFSVFCFAGSRLLVNNEINRQLNAQRLLLVCVLDYCDHED